MAEREIGLILTPRGRLRAARSRRPARSGVVDCESSAQTVSFCAVLCRWYLAGVTFWAENGTPPIQLVRPKAGRGHPPAPSPDDTVAHPCGFVQSSDRRRGSCPPCFGRGSGDARLPCARPSIRAGSVSKRRSGMDSRGVSGSMWVMGQYGAVCSGMDSRLRGNDGGEVACVPRYAPLKQAALLGVSGSCG